MGHCTALSKSNLKNLIPDVWDHEDFCHQTNLIAWKKVSKMKMLLNSRYDGFKTYVSRYAFPLQVVCILYFQAMLKMNGLLSIFRRKDLLFLVSGVP